MDNKVNGAGTVTGRDDNKFEIKILIFIMVISMH